MGLLVGPGHGEDLLSCSRPLLATVCVGTQGTGVGTVLSDLLPDRAQVYVTCDVRGCHLPKAWHRKGDGAVPQEAVSTEAGLCVCVSFVVLKGHMAVRGCVSVTAVYPPGCCLGLAMAGGWPGSAPGHRGLTES